MLGTIVGDVRFALRQIARSPLFSTTVILVVALGIGINAGMLTALNTYIGRPAPGIDADARLARLTPRATPVMGQPREIRFSYPDLLDLRRQQNVFADVAGFESAWLAADFGAGAELVAVTFATANYFRTLGVAMAAGNGFPSDVDASTTPIAVISQTLWMKHFGGSPDAIGKTVRVMNRPFTIVGVAPPQFTGLNTASLGRPTVWLPLDAEAIVDPAARDRLARRDSLVLTTVARLAPGVDADDVERMTSGLSVRIAREAPNTHRNLAIVAERLTGVARSQGDRFELIVAFWIVIAFVVLITCTNVSALLLGRAVTRRREVGVRLSLGATRVRLLRQLLTESLVLALAGAALGLVLYTVAIKVAYATIPEVTYGLEARTITFVYAAAFAVIATIVFGLAPALHATRTDLSEAMKSGGALSIRRSRLQAAFVVAQLACSQPALVITSLVLTEMRRPADDPVNATAAVVTMRTQLVGPSYMNDADSTGMASRATMLRVRDRIGQVPGARSAAIASAGGGDQSFAVQDAGGAETSTRMRQSWVSSGYFSTMGIRVLRGRELGDEEDRRGSTAVVVNEEAARRLWPGENAVGKRIVRRDDENAVVGSGATLEVLGVAEPEPPAAGDPRPVVYLPLATGGRTTDGIIAVRTSGDARSLVPAIREAIREVEPLATVDNIATLAERYASRQREATVSNQAAFVVGVAALLLASLGLYAIIAFAVAQRTREIGVRLAIGASPREVVRHFFKAGIKVTAIGLAIGLPATLVGIRLVQASVVGFTLRSIAAFVVVIPVLIAVAAVASWLPARQAGRVDPLVALQSE